ncbi:unnamed protein product [Boreogadus saida]
MGESAELTQMQHDQSHIVSFPKLKLDERQLQLHLTGTEPALSQNNIPKVHERACHPTPEPRDASGRTVRTETEKPVATPRVHERHPCTPEPRDASRRTVRTETKKPVATEAGCAYVCHRPTRAHLGKSR